MRNLLPLFCLILLSCGSDLPLEPPTEDMRQPTRDVAYTDISCDLDAELKHELCETQCGLTVSTPPQQNQPLVSGAVFSACRRLSQEMCVDPGAVWSHYVGTVFQISRTICEAGEPYCISTDAGVLAITVVESVWFYDAMREALMRESI